MKLSQLRAIISGGASGLGQAVATRLASHGARIAILDRSAAGGAAAAPEETMRYFQADVTDEGAVDAAVAAVCVAWGGLDLAVNCAGIATATRLIGRQGVMTGSFFRQLIDINLTGTLLLSKSAAAAMQHNTPNADGERGLIVMTASVAAFEGQIGQVAYAASKGGIAAMTLPMARELAGSGIRVMSIAPGLFRTPMLAALSEEAQASLGQQVPFPPRLGRPAEFAALVAHLVENPMLNGETIRLDGALRMQPR